MGKTDRDSNDDLRDCFPDAETIYKRLDRAYSDKVYEEAMANPELDAALAERKPPAEPVADPAGLAAPEAELALASPASPWANARADDIDKSSLPSASAPKADAPAAAFTSPIVRRESHAARPRARKGLPGWLLPVAAAIAVLSPVAMWLVVSRQPPRGPAEAGAAAESAQIAVPASAEAGVVAPVQSTAPSEAPAPSAEIPEAQGSSAASTPSAMPAPPPASRARPVPTLKPSAGRSTPNQKTHPPATTPSSPSSSLPLILE